MSSAAAALARLGRRVEAIATTDLLSGPKQYFQADVPTLLVSFGRSGSSPESVAVVNLADQLLRECHQLVFTCNEQGTLYQHCRERHNSLAILLPPETHDQSFAMTSSFTAMMLAASLVFNDAKGGFQSVAPIARAARELLNQHTTRLKDLAAESYSRVVYLGSNGFKALAREAALKLLELTDGKVIAAFDSPLGFRHGPKTIVTRDTLLFVFVSNDPYTRRYDLDLLARTAPGCARGAGHRHYGAARGRRHRGRLLARAACGRGRRRRALLSVHRLRPALRILSIAGIGQQTRSTDQFRYGQPRRSRRDHPYAVTGAAALYLGVDGGGTKTAWVLIDSNGSIRATHLAAGSYYLTIGLDALGTLLADGVKSVLAKASLRAEDLDFPFSACRPMARIAPSSGN
jgi:fructoselysine-6-P-deglycase FrlB-like protein